MVCVAGNGLGVRVSCGVGDAIGVSDGLEQAPSKIIPVTRIDNSSSFTLIRNPLASTVTVA